MSAKPRPESWPLLDDILAKWSSRNVLTGAQFDALSAAAKRRAFSISSAWETKFVVKLQATLTKALRENLSSADWMVEAQKVVDAFGGGTKLGLYSGQHFSPAYAETVFRTNVSTALAAGRYADLFSPTGMRMAGYVMLSAVHDDRNTTEDGCPGTICRELDGKVFPKTDPDVGRILTPLHFGCFAGETLVRARPLWVSRFLYAGKVLHVLTRNGRRLAVTPNHPVATPQGLAPAHTLRQGGYVVSDRGNGIVSAAGLSDVGENDKPRPIEEIFEALRSCDSARFVSASGEEFHGDAFRRKGDIEVVSADWKLLAWSESTLAKRHGELVLEQATPRLAKGVCSGSPSAFRGGAFSASGGLPSRAELFLNLRSGPAAPFQEFGLAPATQRFSFAAKRSNESRPRDASLLRELLHREPPAVELDEIVEIREVEFLGHVYDLQTQSGLLSAGGIYCSNCRCTVIELDEEDVAAGGYEVSDSSSFNDLLGADQVWGDNKLDSLVSGEDAPMQGVDIGISPEPVFEGTNLDPIEEFVRAWSSENFTQAVEHGVAFDADGRSIWTRTTGQKSEIEFSAGDSRALTNVRLFSHNHPSGGPLSDWDIQTAATLNMQEIRAVGRVELANVPGIIVQEKGWSVVREYSAKPVAWAERTFVLGDDRLSTPTSWGVPSKLKAEVFDEVVSQARASRIYGNFKSQKAALEAGYSRAQLGAEWVEIQRRAWSVIVARHPELAYRERVLGFMKGSTFYPLVPGMSAPPGLKTSKTAPPSWLLLLFSGAP